MSKIDEVAGRLYSLFDGLKRAHGSFDITDGGDGVKVGGRAYTAHEPYTRDLWVNHLKGEKGLGVIPIRDDAKCLWGVIDIDVYPLDHRQLEAQCLDLKLPVVICRSKSGGAHLFLFLAEPVPARMLREKMAEWAIALGHPGVEVFPKQNALAGKNDVGNWLNMPYFNAKTTERFAYKDGQPISVTEFLDFAESRKVSQAALEGFSLMAGDDREFDDGPPCIQYLAARGFPRGSRNAGLFNLAVFARFAHGDDWKDKVDEYNRTFISPPLATAEVMTIIKSASRKDYFYGCDKAPIASSCNKDVCRQRKYGIGGNSEASVAPLMLGGLSKIDSDPPIWIIDVEGYRLEVQTDDLLQQQRFRKMCLEKISRLPPLVKQPLWEALIRDRLQNVEIIEAPPDSGPEGQFMLHLESFCTSRVTAASIDELLLGKPFRNAADKRTYFRSPDFIRYLDQQHFREFKERQIWAMLRKGGAKHHQFQLKGKCVMAWSVGSFNEQTEAHAATKIDEGGM